MSEYGGYGYDGSSIRNPITTTASGALEAPKEIIPNVTAARTIYWNYRTEHGPRTLLYAQIEGLIAGNPPYNASELEAQGLSHISNFNNMDARSLFERSALAYWNLLNQTEYIAKFELKMPPQAAEDGSLEALVDGTLNEYATIMARHFNDVVRSWKDFNTQFNTLTGQLCKLGVSPVLWPDENDWRWKTIEMSRFFIKDQAAVDTDSMTAVCVESIFTVQSLYQIYQTAKAYPSATQWNVEELETYLLYKANSFLKPQEQGIFNMMDLQVRLQNGDGLYTGSFSDDVRLVSLLYREYDGSISHYIFDKYWDSGNGNFLFKHVKQYASFEDVFIIFTASPGEFTIHSNRGLGHKIFAGSQATMQLDCSTVDMARWAGTLVLQTPASDPSSMDGIRLYPGVPTNIGSATLANNTLGANITQVIGASQYISSKLNYNLSNSGDDPSTPDKNLGSVSDSTARRQAYKEFGVLKNNIAHYYSLWDGVIHNMVAKMLRATKGSKGYEYAKEWKERCIADGVPEVIFSVKASASKLELNRYIKVKAARVAGDGSDVAFLMGLEELAPWTGSFGARAQRNFMKMKVSAALGHEYIDEFVDPLDASEASAAGASVAGLENNDMKQGESPIFSPDNDHKAHFATHMAVANFVIQSMQQQQMDPITADKIFTVLVPHMGDHWAALSRSPFAITFVKQNLKVWKQVQDYATLNRRNAAKMQQAELKKRAEAEQRQNQVLSEEKLKEIQTLGDERRADFKAQATVQRTKETADKRGEIMQESARANAATKRLAVELDAQSKQAATSSLANKPTPELRQDIEALNGATPAPYDIENI